MPVLLGHTLGTPALSLAEALDLFAAANLDGAEIIWQNGYKAAIPEDDDGTIRRSARRRASDLGLTIGCLTPYVTELNSLDPDVRQRDISRIERALEVASELGAPRMRIYGGTWLGSEPAHEERPHWSALVDSLARLGAIAEHRGVVLSVENHFSTMTVSAAQTARLVAEVASPAVGILYDQANLAFTHCEPFEKAIQLQAPWISHVHVKDLEFIDPNRRLTTGAVASIEKSNRVHMSRMVGDGVLDWNAIIGALHASGYDGSYSLEYEYRWNPEDLPEPSLGFPESSRRIKAIFDRIAAAGPRTGSRGSVESAVGGQA
jgi:L-ribulose-5-phosphate 3-epimerase